MRTPRTQETLLERFLDWFTGMLIGEEFGNLMRTWLVGMAMTLLALLGILFVITHFVVKFW